MSKILTSHDGPVTTIRFNRPERKNAFDAEMLEGFATAVEEAGIRYETRVVVVTGNEEAFSTGADLNLYRGYGPLEVREANLSTWMRVFDLLEALPKPVVASVSGWAVAGGTELTLACDLVVASETAVFGLSEARVGVIPGAGAAVRLPRWVGRASAKELLMLGDSISAQEAHRIGLVNRLAAPADLARTTQELATELAARSPLVLAAAKRAVNLGADLPLAHGMTYVLQEFALLFASNDQKEGMTAFLEKRPARFTGT